MLNYIIGERVEIQYQEGVTYDYGVVTGVQRDGTILVHGMETICFEQAIPHNFVKKIK